MKASRCACNSIKLFGDGIIIIIFFLILAHPVYKMWIIQESNTLELWNKLNFEEKKRILYAMFKIFSTYICWINIYNATLELAVRYDHYSDR